MRIHYSESEPLFGNSQAVIITFNTKCQNDKIRSLYLTIALINAKIANVNELI